MTLLVQVEQATGCRNEHVHAAPERLDLRRLPDSAENHGGKQGEVAAVHAQAIADLCGQFTGGREHEGANGAAVGGFP